MALALYRKYRPATFAEVIGQEHVTDPLRTALSAGRINHAYLFSGPRGCGKTSSARILARSLNCEQGPTPDPCGVCSSCIALAPEGPGSLDVVELDAASHGGVDDTRELRDRAFYMPAESRYRVFIIDEAHMVTPQGFNALLKIVEEPPEHLVFIFATTEPDKVLTTIRSRTHHYPFRLMPPAVMRGLLERLCEQEGVPVEPAVYPLVIQAGGGSARDSLSVLDQLLAGAGEGGVTYRHAMALLGVTDAALLDEMVDALAAGDGASVFGAVDRVAEAGHDPRRFAADLLQRMRDLVILSAVPGAAGNGLISAPDDQLESMTGQAQRLGTATASRWADVLHTGLVEMRGTTAPRLVLELMCARMLLPAASLADGALLQRLERMERRMAIAGEDPGPGTGEGDRSTDLPGDRTAPSSGSLSSGSPSGGADGAGRQFRRRSQEASPTGGQPGTGASPAVPAAAAPGVQADGSRSGAAPAAVPASPAAASPSSTAPAPDTRGGAAAQPDAGTVPDEGGPSAPGGTARDSHDRTEHRTAQDRTDPAHAGSPVQDRAPAPSSTPPEQPVRAQAAPAGPDLGLPAPPGRRTSVPAAGAGPDLGLPAAPGRRPRGGDPAPAAPSTWAAHGEPSGTDRGPARERQGATPPTRTAQTPPPAPTTQTQQQVPSAPPAAAPAATAPAGVGVPDVTDVRRVWKEILASVQRTRRTTQVLLEGATVTSVEGGVLELTMSTAALARRVNEPANIELLRKSLQEVLGVSWQIRCDTGTPAPPPAAASRQPVDPSVPLPPEPPAEDDDIPDDYGAEPDPNAPPVKVQDPQDAAIELLTSQLGARPLDERA
ncbi:DNA polymerase III subunit gamma and tau [Nakamurella sp. YIM 132087]|uniref:DNA polymerase III subunit gamma/tau n=1 Tax=Nakamurella alba TaxID=2665158 RepID=A0A7K1FMP7_9ACTN|nr:DNA polymerase III subunit gamma and tau [Nakamurella alba]MTD15360.1 DNA polymerase III subunit gamma and tau [Nakamurella alba]